MWYDEGIWRGGDEERLRQINKTIKLKEE